MFIIDFRNKNMSKYCFSVINNSNVDIVNFYSRFTQYATGTSIYLKVRSKDDTYVDKIAIASENVSVDEDALVVKWVMGAVSTHCKQVDLQLQFEKDDGEIIAQTGIVTLTLADTIDVEELIPIVYPKILKEIQDEIEDLYSKNITAVSMTYSNDVLSIVFKNQDNQTLISVQTSIPLSDKVKHLNISSGCSVAQAYELTQGLPFITSDGITLCEITELGDDRYHVRAIDDEAYGVGTAEGSWGLESFIEDSLDYIYYVTSENVDEYINGKVDKTGQASKLYGTNSDGEQAIIPVEDETGDVARRDEHGQLIVPLTPTANGHATSKNYVDTLVANIKKNHYIVVNTTTYPTLADFLASTGEEGFLYLYPIDTSDLTKGYYRYIWENNSWLALGTTEIDLSDYVDLSSSQTITGVKTFGRSNNSVHDLIIFVNSSANTYKFRRNGNALELQCNGVTTWYINDDVVFSKGSRPITPNTYDLGSTNYTWKDLYLAGNIYTPSAISNGTNSFSVDNVMGLFNMSSASSESEIKWSRMNTFSKTANTTFTFETAKTNCLNEYKAIITNSGSSSIVITLPSGVKIKCNDDNVSISNNTFTLPAGVSVELNCMNNCCVLINWDAQ